MVFDFSVFKNIDLANPENIIFFGIIFAVCLVVFLVVVFILAKIIKEIKKIFKIRVEKKKEVVQQESQLHKNEEPGFTPTQKLANESMGPIQHTEHEEQNTEIKKPVGTPEQVNQKDITEGLAKLKGENTQEEDKFAKIEIPRAKRFQQQPTTTNETGSEARDEEKESVVSRIAVKGFNKTAVTTNGGVLGSVAPIHTAEKYTAEKSVGASQAIPTAMPGDKEKSFFKKPEVLKDKLGGKKEESKNDSILFGDKEEITRLEMDRKLRRDPKIWKAQKDLLLNLTPIERVKMEKEIFDATYGRNISKTDLVRNLRRVGREMAGTSDLKKKQVLRRKMDFFKKIGGIK